MFGILHFNFHFFLHWSFYFHCPSVKVKWKNQILFIEKVTLRRRKLKITYKYSEQPQSQQKEGMPNSLYEFNG